MIPAPSVQLSVTGEISRAELRTITEIAHQEAGLVIAQSKSSMVQSRIGKRMRKLGIASFSDYCAIVSDPDGQEERRNMISVLTTNVSNFFREAHHFDLLEEEFLPSLLERARAGGRVRLWSAGCSNGQEAYSLAMTVLKHARDAGSFDIRILATDIDPVVVAHGSRGLFSEDLIRDVPETMKAEFFDAGSEGWQVKKMMRNLVTFKELNLLQPWPMLNSFDVIFCRNVAIYFDAATQTKLWNGFQTVLSIGGLMCVGHSERIAAAPETQFENVGITAYRKIAT